MPVADPSRAHWHLLLAGPLAVFAVEAAPTPPEPAPRALDGVDVRDTRQAPGLLLDAAAPTGSRLGLTLRETPASVEVVPGETVRARGDRSLNDAITRLTGFASSASPGNGGTALSARGFAGQGSVMQLYDGTRTYVGAGTVTFPFDPWTVGSLEVLRGPASVLYGEGAIGGVVNVVPKRPTRLQAPVDVYGAIGTDGVAALGLGTGGPIGERWSYRIDAIQRRDDGFVDRGESSSWALSTALRWELIADLSVTFQYDGGRQRPQRYWGTPVVNGQLAEGLRTQNYNVADSVIRYEDDWTRLRVDWRAAEGVRVRHETYFLDTDRHWRNVERYAFAPGAGTVTRTDFLEIYHNQWQFGQRFDLTVDSTVAGRPNRLLVGFDTNRIRFRHSNNGPFAGTSVLPATGFDPGLFVNVAGTSRRFETSTRQWSAFAENRLSVTPTVAVVAGLRYDRIEFNRLEVLTPANSFARPFETTVGRIGFTWDPQPGTTLYAQVATGTDPLGSLITTTVAQRSFELTTGRQIEAGLKQSFLEGSGEWTFAAYQIVKNDLLTSNPATPATSLQVGQQSSRGLEATVALAAGAGWALGANAAVLDARFDDFSENVGGVATSRAGNTPVNVPERLANVFATWDVDPRWRVGGIVRHVGPRFANTANTARLPVYTVVDLFASLRVSRDLTLTARVQNATDAVVAIAPYAAQWILGAPRRFVLEANARF